LICPNPHTFRIIREKFSIQNPNYKQRRFAPRFYIITPAGAFEVGMWNEIHKFILSLALPIDLKVSKEFQQAFKPRLGNIPILNVGTYTYHDYQLHTIKEFLEHGRGISLLATSAGKSLIVGGLCKSIHAARPDDRTLIIVPNTSLLQQTYTDFMTDYNLPIIERWGDDIVPTYKKPVLVANMQILSSDLDHTVAMLKDYDQVIIDEVHRVGEKDKKAKNAKGKQTLKNQLSKIVHNIDTPNKFGLTGTLPDSVMACWNILGKVGPILYEKSSYEIRQKGTAADVLINVIYMEHSEEPEVPMVEQQIEGEPEGVTELVVDTSPAAKYQAEKKFLYKSPKRNAIINKIVRKLDGNILILVDNIEQGEIMIKCLEDTGKKVTFIQGSTDTEDRAAILAILESSTGNVTVAMSQIFSTGISVKNLHHIIFTGIGKSTVKIMQSIGRGMRLHETKDIARIYDLSDNTEYSKRHVLRRIDLYVKEKLEYRTKKIQL
jgi:superfamily II DNA or RNA helicase